MPSDGQTLMVPQRCIRYQRVQPVVQVWRQVRLTILKMTRSTPEAMLNTLPRTSWNLRQFHTHWPHRTYRHSRIMMSRPYMGPTTRSKEMLTIHTEDPCHDLSLRPRIHMVEGLLELMMSPKPPLELSVQDVRHLPDHKQCMPVVRHPLVHKQRMPVVRHLLVHKMHLG